MNSLVFVWSFLLLSSLGSAFCLSAGIYLFCRCIGIKITALTLVVRKDEESGNG